MAFASILVGLILGFGAVQELYERGIVGGLLQPAIMGALGAGTSILLIWSGVARLRRRANRDGIAVVAAGLTIVVHVYGMLPPHHNVGFLAAAIAIGYGFLLFAASLHSRWNRERALS
jgi:hypothetical protein